MGGGPQLTDGMMPRKALEAEITDPLELEKVPEEGQEKFRLLLSYIHPKKCVKRQDNLQIKI